MEVKKVVKTPEGTVKFKGELSEEEHSFALSVGLTTLLQAGAIQMYAPDEEEEELLSKVGPGSETMN